MADGQRVTEQEAYALIVYLSARNPELVKAAWEEGQRRAATATPGRVGAVPRGN